MIWWGVDAEVHIDLGLRSNLTLSERVGSKVVGDEQSCVVV